MSPPPHGINTTKPAFIERQSTISRSSPPPKTLEQKAKSSTKVYYYQPLIIYLFTIHTANTRNIVNMTYDLTTASRHHDGHNFSTTEILHTREIHVQRGTLKEITIAVEFPLYGLFLKEFWVKKRGWPLKGIVHTMHTAKNIDFTAIVQTLSCCGRTWGVAVGSGWPL